MAAQQRNPNEPAIEADPEVNYQASCSHFEEPVVADTEQLTTDESDSTLGDDV